MARHRPPRNAAPLGASHSDTLEGAAPARRPKSNTPSRSTTCTPEGVLDRGLDWLEVEATVDAYQHVRERVLEIRRRQKGAREFRVGDHTFSLESSRGGRVVQTILQNSATTVVIDPRWLTVSVRITAKALAREAVGWCIEKAQSTAALFGVVKAVRLKRVDIFADLAAVFEETDESRFVGHLARRSSAHRIDSRFTGVTFKSGRRAAVRVYDKAFEQKEPGVRWRLEYQLSGRWLRSRGITTENLASELARIWRDRTTTLRLTVPGRTRAERRQEDPRWRLARSAFPGEAEGPARMPRRSPAPETPVHALAPFGAMLAFLGSRGRLPVPDDALAPSEFFCALCAAYAAKLNAEELAECFARAKAYVAKGSS